MMPHSIAQIPQGSPSWMTVAVIAALVLHVGGGSVGIMSGYAAAFVRKGEALHRAFGSVFFISMLTMAAAGTGLSVWIREWGNVAGGTLVFYLVATGWAAVLRPERKVGGFEYIAFAFISGVAALLLSWGVRAAASPHGFGGYGAALYYAFGALSVLLGALDFHVLRRGGVAGVQRIARHLWRMCFALFIASASFFLGQQKVMPAFMHGSPVLVVLGVAPLGLMVLWLVRVRFPSRPSRSSLVATA